MCDDHDQDILIRNPKYPAEFFDHFSPADIFGENSHEAGLRVTGFTGGVSSVGDSA